MKTIMKGCLTVLMVGIAAEVGATPIDFAGSSWGEFGDPYYCSEACYNLGTFDTSHGDNTQVRWGSQSSWYKLHNPSKLTSVDYSFSDTTDAYGVKLAKLEWYNSATLADKTPDYFKVDWTLHISFTAPDGYDTYASHKFTLGVYNSLNPPGDLLWGLELADLGFLVDSLKLAGIEILNPRYWVTGGELLSHNGKTLWYNPENNKSSLYIKADFKAKPHKVPEPATLALFGLGLVATAFARRAVGRPATIN